LHLLAVLCYNASRNKAMVVSRLKRFCTIMDIQDNVQNAAPSEEVKKEEEKKEEGSQEAPASGESQPVSEEGPSQA
jgi:hypothetical protein